MRLPNDPTGASERPVHLVYDDPQLADRHRAGRALRRLGAALVGRALAAEDLHALTAWAESHAEAFERRAARTRPDDYLVRRYTIAGPQDGDRMVAFSERPLSGPANPSAGNLVVWRDGEVTRAVAVFDRLDESSPGRVHGGLTAAYFDDVMGYVMVAEPIAAFTGELAVRYLGGMLIGVPVHFACRITERRENVLTVRGTAHLHEADGELVSEATGRFVVMSPKRLGLPVD